MVLKTIKPSPHPVNTNQVVLLIWHGQNIPFSYQSKIRHRIQSSPNCVFVLLTDHKSAHLRNDYLLKTAKNLKFHFIFTIENYVQALCNSTAFSKKQWFQTILIHLDEALKNKHFAIASDIERLFCLHFKFNFPGLCSLSSLNALPYDSLKHTDILYADCDRAAFDPLPFPIKSQYSTCAIGGNDLILAKTGDGKFVRFCLKTIAGNHYPSMTNNYGAIQFSGPDILNKAIKKRLIKATIPSGNINHPDVTWTALGKFELEYHTALNAVSTISRAWKRYKYHSQKQLSQSFLTQNAVQTLQAANHYGAALLNKFLDADNHNEINLTHLMLFEALTKDHHYLSSASKNRLLLCRKTRGPLFQIIVRYYPHLAIQMLNWEEMDNTTLSKNISYCDGIFRNLVFIILECCDPKTPHLHSSAFHQVFDALMVRANKSSDVATALRNAFYQKTHQERFNLILYRGSTLADPFFMHCLLHFGAEVQNSEILSRVFIELLQNKYWEEALFLLTKRRDLNLNQPIRSATYQDYYPIHFAAQDGQYQLVAQMCHLHPIACYPKNAQILLFKLAERSGNLRKLLKYVIKHEKFLDAVPQRLRPIKHSATFWRKPRHEPVTETKLPCKEKNLNQLNYVAHQPNL